MELLGKYNSQLTGWYYQELVTLLKQSIQQGGYAGGASFNQDALAALQQQCQSFGTLPQPLAGQRVLDDTLNYPLSLLAAEFAALQSESGSFDSQLNALLAELQKQTGLIDQLLFAAELEAWANTKPQFGDGSSVIKWHFGIGYGPVDTNISELWMDPANSVIYNSRPPLVSLLSDQVYTGLGCASTVKTIEVENLAWNYTAGNAQVEEIYSENWTSLTLLEPQPLVNFSAVPVVTPSNPFVITGSSNLGALTVYVRTSFTGRLRHSTLQVTNGTSVPLTPYTLDLSSFTVMLGNKLFSNGTDYAINANGSFTPRNVGVAQTVDIWFVEQFPSYQCSIDQASWSSLLMLDPARPYPDNTSSFAPIAYGKNASGNQLMPITDELGVPVGAYIQIGANTPTQSYLLQITGAAAPDTVGATAVLEIDFQQFGFLNALQISPFAEFPMTLKRVEVQGLLANTRKTVWTGSAVIDRTTVIPFPETACGKAFLTFYQQNYSQEQLTVQPADALRRNVMTQLQATLPFEARAIPSSPTQTYTGAQYEFGLENIQGQLWTTTNSVFVSGPNRLTICPDAVRFDADVQGTVSLYLCYQAFDISGQTLDLNMVGASITPNTSFVFPFSVGVNRTQVDHVDVYLRIVHRSSDALVERYMMQVASV